MVWTFPSPIKLSNFPSTPSKKSETSRWVISTPFGKINIIHRIFRIIMISKVCSNSLSLFFYEDLVQIWQMFRSTICTWPMTFHTTPITLNIMALRCFFNNSSLFCLAIRRLNISSYHFMNICIRYCYYCYYRSTFETWYMCLLLYNFNCGLILMCQINSLAPLVILSF